MSGHSKWHNIRLRKGKQDAERGARFTKLAREIIIAAKQGGGNPDANIRLRLAIQKAREASMPQDKIKNAIQRGTGEVEGAAIEELMYEAYAPGGVAMMIFCATDNRNRTVADVRSILNKNNGRLAESGAVSYLFGPPVGLITIERDGVEEDAVLTAALEAGADDVQTTDDGFEVYTSPGDLAGVADALREAGLKVVSSDVTRIPTTTVRVEGKEAQQVLKLMDLLEEHDDIQAVHANFDIPDEEMEADR
ncbi:MAG: YebC/PmpR family DNA-binding transcriptional regulator [Chthonomonadales bacterium]|nr:YebC/PmpR family DNA-binding transcriptional regulator [Chthonomonadales bacterium]